MVGAWLQELTSRGSSQHRAVSRGIADMQWSSDGYQWVTASFLKRGENTSSIVLSTLPMGIILPRLWCSINVCEKEVGSQRVNLRTLHSMLWENKEAIGRKPCCIRADCLTGCSSVPLACAYCEMDYFPNVCHMSCSAPFNTPKRL